MSNDTSYCILIGSIINYHAFSVLTLLVWHQQGQFQRVYLARASETGPNPWCHW